MSNSSDSAMPEDYVAPNTAPKCAWKDRDTETCPHRYVPV